VASIEAEGGKARAFGSDARREEQVVELVQTIEREVGPLEVCVFNVGGNVRFPVRETTARVYTKVWEMAALAGFLVGREAAKGHGAARPRHDPVHGRDRQPARRQGLRRLRGRQARAARARAEHGERTGARGHPRRARGDRRRHRHAVHPRQFPERYKLKDQAGILDPEAIAENYWRLHQQARSAWTHELDLRPWMEPW
jgi:hypothetical protein